MATVVHLGGVGLEKVVVVNVVPRAPVVRVEALAAAVVGDDHVVLDVVHLGRVRWRAVVDVRDIGGAVPAVDGT